MDVKDSDRTKILAEKLKTVDASTINFAEEFALLALPKPMKVNPEDKSLAVANVELGINRCIEVSEMRIHRLAAQLRGEEE